MAWMILFLQAAGQAGHVVCINTLPLYALLLQFIFYGRRISCLLVSISRPQGRANNTGSISPTGRLLSPGLEGGFATLLEGWAGLMSVIVVWLGTLSGFARERERERQGRLYVREKEREPRATKGEAGDLPLQGMAFGKDGE